MVRSIPGLSSRLPEVATGFSGGGLIGSTHVPQRMGAENVRTIGIVRARCKIGMTNLVSNMRRFVWRAPSSALYWRPSAHH